MCQTIARCSTLSATPIRATLSAVQRYRNPASLVAGRDSPSHFRYDGRPPTWTHLSGGSSNAPQPALERALQFLELFDMQCDTAAGKHECAHDDRPEKRTEFA